MRRAAKQGEASAQYNLGLMYFRGEGVPQDYGAAFDWFQLAAEQGDIGAQLALGLSYSLGWGVAKNYVRAYAWLDLAVVNGRQDALDAHKVVSKYLTWVQIAEAQALRRKLSAAIQCSVGDR